MKKQKENMIEGTNELNFDHLRAYALQGVNAEINRLTQLRERIEAQRWQEANRHQPTPARRTRKKGRPLSAAGLKRKRQAAMAKARAALALKRAQNRFNGGA